jgi:secreted trypsin-like serine protease
MSVRTAAVACSLLLSGPAVALVGGAPTSDLRGLVMITGARGFCTGIALARDLVLTVAHCVPPGGDYKLVEFDAQRQPHLRDIAKVVRHPRLDPKKFDRHTATADVALLKLAKALPQAAQASLASSSYRATVGERLTIAGYGLAEPGNPRTGGNLRVAALAVTGKPGNLQIRLYDPATRNESLGLGGCTGDSGAPVFAEIAGRRELVGLVSWSTAPNSDEGCGGLTGVTPLALYRGWVVETAKKLGSPLALP